MNQLTTYYAWIFNTLLFNVIAMAFPRAKQMFILQTLFGTQKSFSTVFASLFHMPCFHWLFKQKEISLYWFFFFSTLQHPIFTDACFFRSFLLRGKPFYKIHVFIILNYRTVWHINLPPYYQFHHDYFHRGNLLLQIQFLAESSVFQTDRFYHFYG